MSLPVLSEEKLKYEIAESLIKRSVNLDNKQIAEILGLQPNQIDDIEKALESKKTVGSDEKPKSWDYVLAFNVGDPAQIRKPNRKELRVRSESKEAEDPSATQEWDNGIPQNKYFGQIFHDIWKRLEKALLTVKAYRSEDKQRMFLIVGITDDNLKKWADDRDTDLLLDPTNACQVARTRGFPLALQTKLSPDEPDDKFPLPLSNWASMYAQYNHRANAAIYQHYPRIYGQDEPQTIFDEKTRLRIIYESIISDQAEGGAEIEISTLILDSRHPLKGVFPLHNETILQEFRRDWVNRWNIKSLFWVPLDRVRNYFGEPVAFYFGFLSFYLQWLVWPSIIGSFFFIAQLAVGTVDIPAIWLCAIFIILWSVAFVDYWGRQEARYRHKWGMTKFQQKAVARPQFHGEWTRDDITGEWVETFAFFSRALRSGSALSSIITFLLGCVASVISVLVLKDRYSSTDSIVAILLGVVNGVMIFIFDKIYAFLSKWFNDWENHRTEEDYQNALILKSFFFKFFNSFASLFYLGFVRPYVKKDIYETNYNDGEPMTQTEIAPYVLAEVRTQLATLFITAIVIQNSLEVGLPYIFGKVKEGKAKKAAIARGEEPEDKRSQVEKEFEKEPYANTIDDMAELIVQYGYVTLFVICLPITPLLATINNIFEMKVDAFGLVNSRQRPHPNGSFGLGAWNSVLGFFSIIAVATNVALVTFQTSVVSDLIPGNEDNDTLIRGQLLFFVAVSVFLSLVVAFEKYVIPDVPEEVERAAERQDLIENVLVLGARITEDAKEPPNKEDDDFFNFDPKAPFVDPSDLPEVPKTNIGVST